jgi:hypothetical protein
MHDALEPPARRVGDRNAELCEQLLRRYPLLAAHERAGDAG